MKTGRKRLSTAGREKGRESFRIAVLKPGVSIMESLMVADQSQNRIMLFSVDEQCQKIGFLHSFPVDKGGISSACFDREG